MPTIHRYDPTSGQLESGGMALLDKWESDDDSLIWLDVDGALDDNLAQVLQDRIKLHPLALQDAARDRHPPKIERFSNCTFLIFKGLNADSVDIDCGTTQIAAFIGDRFLVTRHGGRSPSIERLRSELEADPARFAKGPGALMIRLGRLIVDRYLKILLALEPKLEVYEKGLLGDNSETILAELIAHKSDLIRLQRVFHYQAEVTEKLVVADLPGFNAEDQHGLIDVHEQQARVKSLCALYYQLAADLIDGYISVTSHRLNQIMRVLTIVTVVFVPLSFLAGIYGMNFQNMPELQSRWGYYALLTLMLSVAATLIITFRRKRWL